MSTHILLVLLLTTIVSSEQLFLEPIPNNPNLFSKIHLPHWKAYRYRYMPSVVSGVDLFVSPDPWGEPFPEFTNETVYELCEDMENLMISNNISSCQDYFCSGSTPIFNTTSPSHLRLITYCLYCNRTDWSEFQTLLKTNPQCGKFMNRENTCPAGKCSDICIDNWTVYARYNYFAREGTYEISLCYIRSQNRFVYAEDYYHMYLWPLEPAVEFVKMVIHIIYEIALIVFIIIPHVAHLIATYFQVGVRKHLKKLFGIRMINIFILFWAPIPHIINTFTQAVGRYITYFVAFECVILTVTFIITAVLWLNIVETSTHKILWKNRVLLFSLLGYMGAYYLVLVIVNSFKIPAHIYLPLSGALNYAGAFSGIAIATGLSIEGLRIYLMIGKADQTSKKAAYKLKFMRFLVLADLDLALFFLIVAAKATTLAAPWDVLSPFIYITWAWQFQYWGLITLGLLFYMCFDFERMKKFYAKVFKSLGRKLRRNKSVKEIEMKRKEEIDKDTPYKKF